VSAGAAEYQCGVCGSTVGPTDNFCRTCGIELDRVVKLDVRAQRYLSADMRAIFGSFLLVFGGIVAFLSFLMAIIPMLAFGLGSFLIGMMILYLPESSASIADRLASDSSLPSLLNIERLLEDLDLDEKGIYMPTSGLGFSPRIFVPLALTPNTERPPLELADSRKLFVTIGKSDGDRGILLDAPGSRILSALERTLRIDLANANFENLGDFLNTGFRMLDIAKHTSLVGQDLTVRVEMELTTLLDLEEKLRNSAPRLTGQIGTPIVSAVAAAVSKTAGKYVRLDDAVLQLPERRLIMNLRLSE